MKDWTPVRITPEATVHEAVETIDGGGLQIALVVGENDCLEGVVTDGDVRRGILRGVSLEAPVDEVMNADPTTAGPEASRSSVLALMRKRQLHQVPVVDAEGRVAGLEVVDDLIQDVQRDNPIVLMVGGLGTRLRPLTDDRPKPLLEVGDQPILETIIENFVAYGFHRFYLAVNYKADMIREHFGGGERWGVEISYVEEPKRMGTAGPLSLLPKEARGPEPLIVMNGDLLTKLNFDQLLRFHHEQGAAATMCVREYDFQVPYGVVETEGHRITGIDEKPVHRFFVSAGVNVLEPEALERVPEGAFFDIPDLFEELVAEGREATVFPVREYWMDVGRMDDFEQADGEFEEVFKA